MVVVSVVLGVPLVIGLERTEGANSGEPLLGALSRFETRVFPEGHPRAKANLVYVERIVKFLLWARGGWRLYIGGPRSIGEHIHKTYSPDGARQFDYHFIGEQVYERPFTVVLCEASDVPPAREGGQPLGRHLEGCRIGFDLGASDRKFSAVIDGEPIYSE